MEAEAVVDVSAWEVRIVEPGGSDANLWLSDPDDSQRALFKPVVAKAGRRQGEDWAEKVVERVATRLKVPSARIRMATRNGHPGLLSYDVAPSGYALHTGSVLIGAADSRFEPRAKNRVGHNLRNISDVLRPLASVACGDPFTAYDQFCGYLTLDALVANRDRHEENWAVLRAPSGEISLAPSYDHGNSLGFNLQDTRRALELQRDLGLVTWARRGTADRFEDGRDVSLVALSHQGFDLATPGTRELWLGRLEAVDPTEWPDVLEGIPEMSEVCRTFCIQLLQTNQRRLLDGD